MAADAPLESPPLDGAVDSLAEGTDVCAEVALEEMPVEVVDWLLVVDAMEEELLEEVCDETPGTPEENATSLI